MRRKVNFGYVMIFLFQPLGAYSVSKTTLLGLTNAVAKEIVHDNIRVNGVAPGIVATKFASAVIFQFVLQLLNAQRLLVLYIQSVLGC